MGRLWAAAGAGKSALAPLRLRCAPELALAAGRPRAERSSLVCCHATTCLPWGGLLPGPAPAAATTLARAGALGRPA
jgi:hypothetical protein